MTGPSSVVYLGYKRRVDKKEQPFFDTLAQHFAEVQFSRLEDIPAQWRGSGLYLVRLACRLSHGGDSSGISCSSNGAVTSSGAANGGAQTSTQSGAAKSRAVGREDGIFSAAAETVD